MKKAPSGSARSKLDKNQLKRTIHFFVIFQSLTAVVTINLYVKDLFKRFHHNITTYSFEMTKE